MAKKTAANSDDLYVYETTHRIFYNTSKPVPIGEMIIALQGLEGVLKLVPKAFEGLTGIDIKGSEFLVQTIESGSLLEDVVIKFFFKDRQSLDAFVEKMGENKVVKTTVITAILAGIVGYGLAQAMGSKAAPSITATNSVIIQNGAGTLNMSPETFQAALRASISDKKGAAESALKLIGPARAQPGSSIFMGSDIQSSTREAGVEISSAAIAEAPARIELEPNERLEEYANAKLAIRATNLDSKRVGWAGKLGTREDRLPIELDPSVLESDMFGRQEVQVDAALVFKEKGRSRELKPARIYVRKVHRLAQPASAPHS